MNTHTIYTRFLEDRGLPPLKLHIPQKMPYTFQQILNCKDVGPDSLLRDWINLCLFDGRFNPRKFCGNPTLYKYQMKNLLNCRRGTKGYKTLEEWFADPQLKEQLWKETLKRNRRDKCPYPSPTDVYECHRLNKGSIVMFKSSTAKYVYTLFNAKNVLDPTAGWGGRMLGAMSMGINYTGIDTNVNMKEAYFNLMYCPRPNNEGPWHVECGTTWTAHYRQDNDYEHHTASMIWKSLFDVDFKEGNYDLVLTSPPYSNMEIYEHSSLYDSDDDYYKTFLIPMMNKLMEECNCPICINVSPKIYETLTTKYMFQSADAKIDLRQQMGKQFKTKSQDYIYVWKMDLITVAVSDLHPILI